MFTKPFSSNDDEDTHTYAQTGLRTGLVSYTVGPWIVFNGVK